MTYPALGSILSRPTDPECVPYVLENEFVSTATETDGATVRVLREVGAPSRVEFVVEDEIDEWLYVLDAEGDEIVVSDPFVPVLPVLPDEEVAQ